MIFITVSFWIALRLSVEKLGLDVFRVLASNLLLYFSFVSLGNTGGFVPSISKAKESAHPVFSIIDEPSLLDIRIK